MTIKLKGSLPAGGLKNLRYSLGDIDQNGLVLHLDATRTDVGYPGSGTAWPDSSSSAMTATISGTYYVEEEDRQYLRFSGTGSVGTAGIATVNSLLNFQPNTPFTLFMLFRVDTQYVQSGNSVPISRMISTSPFPGWDIFIDAGNNMLQMHLISNWPTSAIRVGASYDENKFIGAWNSVMFVYDGSAPTTPAAALASTKVYINGQLKTTQFNPSDSNGQKFASAGSTISYTTQAVKVNGRQNTDVQSQWLSVMHCGAYNRALSDSEVKQFYNVERGYLSSIGTNLVVNIDAASTRTWDGVTFKSANVNQNVSGNINGATIADSTPSVDGTTVRAFNFPTGAAEIAPYLIGMGYTQFRKEITWECVAYIESTTGRQTVWSHIDTVSPWNGLGIVNYSLQDSVGGEICWWPGNYNVNGAGTGNWWYTGVAVPTGRWVYAAGTWSGNTMKVYKRDATDSNFVTNTITWGPFNGATVIDKNFTIGGQTDSDIASNLIDGGIGFVRIYNRALTDAEITTKFNNIKDTYGL